MRFIITDFLKSPCSDSAAAKLMNTVSVPQLEAIPVIPMAVIFFSRSLVRMAIIWQRY